MFLVPDTESTQPTTALTCYSPPDPATAPTQLTTNPTSHSLLVPNTVTTPINTTSIDYPHLVSANHLHLTHTTAHILPDDAATINYEPLVAHTYPNPIVSAIATHSTLDSSTALTQLAHIPTS